LIGEQRTNKRFESIKVLVHEMLLSMDGLFNRQEATVHLYGVSTFASMIAMKRGQNPELAAIAGMLHEYYVLKTGINEFPGPNSAEAVRPIIRDIGMFTEEEQITVLRSIFYQNEGRQSHGPYEEIIKDANVLQLYFHNATYRKHESDKKRLRNVLGELKIVGEFQLEEFNDEKETKPQLSEDKRSKLADIAEMLAGQNIIGVPGDGRFREICRYWPDANIYNVLKNSWCAAFVYHSCRLAGFLLPIRYPNGGHRFAGVGAWLEWAQLPDTGFFHRDGHDGFSPQRGDIVIYDKLLSDHSHDHIGIVLGGNENEIWVAEGNRDNENYSSILYRDRMQLILGYIRIDNSYQYYFSGVYNPL